MSPQMKSFQDVRQLAGAELSLHARIGYVALLLAAAGMTVVIASLWLTEPALPVRTQWAFGAMVLIGVSWVSLTAWALRARRPLFARDRVIAGSMAVTFTSLFLAGGIAGVAMAGNAASYGVLVSGGVMLAVAFRIRARARHRFVDLAARRAALS